MVYRVERCWTNADFDRISAAISELCPEYEKLLAEGIAPTEADQVLVERGMASENDLLQIYCRILNLEPFEESEISLPEIFPAISTEYLLNFGLLPYRWDQNQITVLAASPYLLARHADEIHSFYGLELHFAIVRRSLIERLIARTYQVAEADPATPDENEQQLRLLAGDAKIVRLVNEMLSQALEQGASDIHVEPEETQLVIRFRVDGMLHRYLGLPLSDYPAVASRIKLIGNLNIAESRLPQDGRTTFQVGAHDIDIRISTIPVIYGESIVMRLLCKGTMRFDLAELGMLPTMRSLFEQLIAIPHGMILVVGPTGSGKTTTLYSVMNLLNDEKRKIITIEDPVEYQLPGLNQMQINHKIGLSFAAGLRHIVRQDPDVILVGEIRDKETADIAINAALTGRLVLSTLHTNDAIGAITRLVDMGVEPFLITSVLFGVLSQRLARKVCVHCQGSGQTNHGRCKICHGCGYKGRIGIYELLLVDDELRRAVTDGKSGKYLQELAISNGMVPLMEDGLTKVAAKLTTDAEILRIASGAGV